MNKRYATFLYRISFSLITIVAIIVQFVSSSDRPNFSPVNFFSFFTIESNILAAGILLIGAFLALRKKRTGASWDLIRGGATLYMAMTGIIYALFLSGLEVSLQTTIPWVNTVLHYIMPFVMVIDWLIDPPSGRVPLKKALLWVMYPLVYVAYSLIRGHFTDWYPYPFLNVGEHGYQAVLVNSLVISLGVIGLVVVLGLSGKRKR